MSDRKVTFGTIETRIRRDLLKDDFTGQERWSVFQVMAAMNNAVIDTVSRHNAWAGYDEFGGRIYNIDTLAISNNCSLDMVSLADVSVYEVDGETYDEDEFVALIRATPMPLQSRYADAVAYLAAAKLLETGASVNENAQKSAEFFAKGREFAVR